MRSVFLRIRQKIQDVSSRTTRVKALNSHFFGETNNLWLPKIRCNSYRRFVHSCCGEQGQSSVEAAILLPVVLLLIGLLVQPLCLFYTRSIMEQTAAECARILATGDAPQDGCRAFALRRLAGVPEIAPFHVGGKADWDIQFSSGDTAKAVSVSIMGHARPLPITKFFVSSLTTSDVTGIVLSVEAHEQLRADWVEGGFDDWVRVWQD